MQTHFLRLLLFAMALVAGIGGTRAEGAEVALRKRVAHDGPVVRLGDLADIASMAPVAPAELDRLQDTPLLPAPAPGTTLFLSRGRIRDLLASRGVDLSSITLTGAVVVEIEKTKQAAPEAKSAELNLGELEIAMEQAIQKHLEQQAGHSGWRIEIDLDQRLASQLAVASENISVRGGRPPWTGRQRFYLTAATDGDEIVVPTRVAMFQPAVFARRQIERGDLVRRSDVEIRQHEGQLPQAAFFAVEQVVGKEAVRAIRADAIVQQSFVRAPLLVKRGETVTVFARTGGIAVKTVAVARQDGALGDLIQIETTDDKERFAAIVSGRRELEVLATGRSAREFASFDDHKRR